MLYFPRKCQLLLSCKRLEKNRNKLGNASTFFNTHKNYAQVKLLFDQTLRINTSSKLVFCFSLSLQKWPWNDDIELKYTLTTTFHWFVSHKVLLYFTRSTVLPLTWLEASFWLEHTTELCFDVTVVAVVTLTWRLLGDSLTNWKIMITEA